MDLTELWAQVDDRVAQGRFPGAVAAVRHAGRTHVHATGTLDVGGTEPVRDDTQFRIASISKPFGGVLALGLVADGVLALDDDATRWLPELAGTTVLTSPDAPLTDTEPARAPITVGDLLHMTPGFGLLMDDSPLARAMGEQQVGPGPLPPPLEPGEWLVRLGRLPLADRPGAGWRYHTGSDVLGVLLARATGRSLADLLAERVTGPLGLTRTAFWTTDRLPTGYAPGEQGLELFDPPDGAWSAAPAFESLGGGLVSTAGDVLGLLTAIADDRLPGVPASAVLADGLTDTQRTAAQAFLGPGRTWAAGNLELTLQVTDPWTTPGRFGWTGGTGTSGYADPELDLVAVLLTQRMMTGPHDGPEWFWQAAHDAVGRPGDHGLQVTGARRVAHPGP